MTRAEGITCILTTFYISTLSEIANYCLPGMVILLFYISIPDWKYPALRLTISHRRKSDESVPAVIIIELDILGICVFLPVVQLIYRY